MTKLFVAIYLWLASQPVSKYDVDERPLDRQLRLETIAQAISDASKGDRGKAAFLLVQTKHESALRRDVQECRCPAKQCDAGRAHGGFQMQDRWTWPRDRWPALCGVDYDAVFLGASETARFYNAAKLECSYARLGALKTCDVPWAIKRAKEARRLAGAL